MEHEDDVDNNCNWCVRNNPHRLSKGTGRIRTQRTRGDHPDYNILMIGQNTEKSPGDLRRLAITQAPVKDYQLTLVGKTLKEQQQQQQ